MGQAVEVRWEDPHTGQVHAARAMVDYPPTRSYVWSCVWFLQEMVIFAVGARVFWKRPQDDSARLFFWLCIVTVGAYMGGYHWTEIVVAPALIYPFASFAVFVPVVSLHFYLVFPRTNPVSGRHRRLVLGVALRRPGGLPGGALGEHALVALAADPRGGPAGRRRRCGVVRDLALGYIALAVMIFALCIALPGRQLPPGAARGPSGTRSSGSCWPRCSPRS